MEGTSTARRSSYRARSSTGRSTASRTRRGSARNRANKDNSEGSNFREKLIMQCIISGCMFLSVLVVNIIESEVTNDIRGRVKAALSENVAVEDIIGKTEGITGYFGVVEDVVGTIFGSDKDNNARGTEDKEETEAIDTEATEGEFRIDEDILNIMNSEEDVYTRNAKKP